MYLTKYRPQSLRDSFLSRGWDLPFPAPRAVFEPRVDVVEHDKEYVVTLELPGLSRDDFSVTAENDYLTIRGEKKAEREENRDSAWFHERSYGSFSRSFRLGEGVDRNKISAKYHDGVLEVTVAKSKESVKKAIEVKVS